MRRGQSGSHHGISRGAEEQWLEAWGTIKGRPDQPLSYVSHGYRLPERGATLVVSTWRSTGRYLKDHTPAEALTHARVDSLAGALNLAFRYGAPRGKRIEADFRSAAEEFLPLRRHTPTLGIGVDGSTAGFELLRIGHAWAATAALGPLAIGAYGFRTALDEHELVVRA
ncbi:hypothetical protein [Streptomyces sp. NPDC058279]|uniref:hypothetical protein n=1 Tax=Streptomyces sp. NPDC058279 TaxID=3346418 RepID=UPI0036EF9A21